MSMSKWWIAGALVALTAACDGMPGEGEEVLEPSAKTTAPEASPPGGDATGQAGTSNANTAVSTRVTLRLYRDGRTEVLRTLEQPGIATVSPVLTGDHVYEVRSQGKTLAVESGVFSEEIATRSASSRSRDTFRRM